MFQVAAVCPASHQAPVLTQVSSLPLVWFTSRKSIQQSTPLLLQIRGHGTWVFKDSSGVKHSP